MKCLKEREGVVSSLGKCPCRRCANRIIPWMKNQRQRGTSKNANTGAIYTLGFCQM